MFIEDIPDDSKVFVDTNILLYDISGHRAYGESCKRFFERIKRGTVKGITFLIVLNELLHKLVLGEIAEEHGLRLSQVIDFIKVEGMSNLSILQITPQNFTLARKLMKEYFLLSNDALHLAVMKGNNIINLASNDSDFERIDWVTLYKPSKKQ